MRLPFVVKPTKKSISHSLLACSTTTTHSTLSLCASPLSCSLPLPPSLFLLSPPVFFVLFIRTSLRPVLLSGFPCCSGFPTGSTAESLLSPTPFALSSFATASTAHALTHTLTTEYYLTTIITSPPPRLDNEVSLNRNLTSNSSHRRLLSSESFQGFKTLVGSRFDVYLPSPLIPTIHRCRSRSRPRCMCAVDCD